MKALCLSQYGSLENMKMADVTEPSPGAGEVRVRVVASALSPADVKVALGEVKFLHGRRFPMTLGNDFSGVIDALGSEVAGYKVGDAVFGFLPYGPFNNQGAFAEKLLAKREWIAKKPERVSHAQAAAAATSALTALQAMRDIGRLKSGGRVLVTGVSGSVGSIGISVAKKLGAAEIVATGSGAGLQIAKKSRATQLIDRKSQDVIESANGHFDVVFDAAAAFRWKQWKNKLSGGGTYVTTLPSRAFFADKAKSLFAGSRAGFVNVKAKAADLQLLAEWMTTDFPVPIQETIPLTRVPEGLARLRRGEVLGKIAVEVAAGS